MKTKVLFIALIVMQWVCSYAQTFEPTDSISIKTTTLISGNWADMDNDGVMEFVTLSKTADLLEIGYILIEGKTMEYVPMLNRQADGAQFHIADFSRDGYLDVLLSSESTSETLLEIYINDGSGNFEEEVIKIDNFFAKQMAIADFNRDGNPDIITIGESLNRIYAYQEDEWDTLVWNSDGITPNMMLAIDLNKDGWEDILLSGNNKLDAATSLVFINNEGDFDEEPIEINAAGSVISKSDVDMDGDFDLLMSNTTDFFFYENRNDTLKSSNLNLIDFPKTISQIFAADLNSDGTCDIVLNGENNGVPNNAVAFQSGDNTFENESLENADYQIFGDWDWDGDLDLIQFNSTSEGQMVRLLENITSQINIGPANTTSSQVLPMGESVAILWEDVIDDFTPKEAITYDVYLRQDEVAVSPGFEIDRTYRTVVAHGNQGTLTSASYFDLEPGVYEYGIQTVDNAFYALGCNCGGGGSGGADCSGDIHRGEFVVCDEIDTKEYTVCENEEILLVTNENKKGNWFSSVSGYLGVSDSLKVAIIEDEDFFFSVNQSLDCADQQSWILKVAEEGETNDFPDMWVCLGDTLNIDGGGFWDSITWESTSEGLLSDSSMLVLKVSEADTIRVERISEQGCSFFESFSINISDPQLTLNGQNFRTSKGKSVQLNANGGEHYSWTPSNGLNDPHSSSPIATVAESITYLIEMTDSAGCVTSAAVNIFVETSAYVPNLFTPNNDGKNDFLKVYGLEEVEELSFRIFNRSGSLVYESSSATESAIVGWDGTWQGREQPNGVYYWKVSGKYINGNDILFNGERSGAIHLLR